MLNIMEVKNLTEYDKITNVELNYLKNLTTLKNLIHLEHLNLSHCNITNARLNHLTNLTVLNRLNLYNCTTA